MKKEVADLFPHLIIPMFKLFKSRDSSLLPWLLPDCSLGQGSKSDTIPTPTLLLPCLLGHKMIPSLTSVQSKN